MTTPSTDPRQPVAHDARRLCRLQHATALMTLVGGVGTIALIAPPALGIASTVACVCLAAGTGALTLRTRRVRREAEVADAERRRHVAAVESDRDRAEVLAHSRTQFLADMSHEIRTPMNGVIGMVGLLLDSNLTEDQRELAITVRRSGDALLKIINDILDLSKIEAGKMELECIPFAVRHVIADVVDLVAHKAAEKSIALRSDVAPDVPKNLLGDPGRLRQIVLNLTSNAVKFTDEGEVSIHVKLKTKLDDGNIELAVKVIDSGIGIPPDKAERLFKSFSQADVSTMRHYGGTGLGLAICKRLVEMAGGEIGFTSRTGRGSTFWFRVPFGVATQTKPLPARPTHATRNRPTAFDARVLLVEDNVINQKLARRLLERLGLRVDIAENGEVAVRAAFETRYDLIFMDCQMPVMDGLTATGKIRTQEAIGTRTRTPIIAMTANAMKGDREMCLSAGMDDYVSKPITPSALRETVGQWLAARAETA